MKDTSRLFSKYMSRGSDKHVASVRVFSTSQGDIVK